MGKDSQFIKITIALKREQGHAPEARTKAQEKAARGRRLAGDCETRGDEAFALGRRNQ